MRLHLFGSNVLAALCLAVFAAGCERMPWSSSDAGALDVGLTTAQSGTIPGMPFVAAEDVLGKVNDVSVSRADVELRIQELKTLVEAQGENWEKLTYDDLQAILDELIRTELMSQDAAARGIDRSLDTQNRWSYIRRGFFAQEWLRWNQPRLDVTADEINTYYEENKLGFLEPKRIKVRQLVVDSEAQAKNALAQLHSGTVQFEPLVRQISVGSTAAQGGLLEQWLMQADKRDFVFGSEQEAEAAGVISLDPALEAAAFAIDQVGHFSNYVLGPGGQYHIFELVENEDQKLRSVDEMWDPIKGLLLSQKLQGAIENLEQDAIIERFIDRLETVTQ